MFILRHGGKSEIRTLVSLVQWHVPRPRPRKVVERSSLRRKVADYIYIYMNLWPDARQQKHHNIVIHIE